VGCSQFHEGIDDAPATLAKIPTQLRLDLSAGLARDVLVELDEQTVANGGAAMDGTLGSSTQALVSDVGELPAADAEPIIAAAVQAHAAAYRAAQQRVLDRVDLGNMGNPGEVELLFQYENLPLLFVHVRTLQAAIALASSSEVLRLHEDAKLEHQLTASLPLIHQTQAASSGKTGAGTAVAVLDTGCDFSRTEFGSCTAAGATGCKVAYAADFAANDGSRDDNGHGTNVSAIVLGVAPNTKVLALDVFAGSSAASSTILQAVDWTITNRLTYNIKAINLSLGSGLFTTACSSDVFASSLANARAAGILAAVASGNNASSSALASPACVPAAIAVGAVYDANVGGLSYGSAGCADSTTAADKIACFSNSSSLLSLLAPGAPITAGGYTMTGTSQASPHVAGALAVIRAAFPNEALNESVARLTNNGPVIVDARNGVSKHRLDLEAALAGGVAADKTGPTGSFAINADEMTTRSPSVTLSSTASDPSGVPSMCISNTTTCTAFQAFAASKSWSLTSGDGIKTVWVTLKDGAGNNSVLSKTIRLDTTAPTSGTLSASARDRAVALTWSAATDAGSGVAGYTLVFAPNAAPSCAAGKALYSGSGLSFVHSGLQNAAVYGYRICPVDLAGNVSEGAIVTARPLPEFDAPVGNVVINAGAAFSKSAAATLTLSATDASGTASVCISNTTTCATWVAFSSSKPWTLGSSNGVATVRVWFRDIYGSSSSAPVMASTTVDTTLPTLGAFTATPSSGRVTLAWTAASDASGIASYTLVWQIGATAPNSCAVGSVAYAGTGLSFVHTGRANGTYSYRLCAADHAGNVAAGVVRTVTVK
jgi:subtilisin family serine protease